MDSERFGHKPRASAAEYEFRISVTDRSGSSNASTRSSARWFHDRVRCRRLAWPVPNHDSLIVHLLNRPFVVPPVPVMQSKGLRRSDLPLTIDVIVKHRSGMINRAGAANTDQIIREQQIALSQLREMIQDVLGAAGIIRYRQQLPASQIEDHARALGPKTNISTWNDDPTVAAIQDRMDGNLRQWHRQRLGICSLA